MLETEQTHDIRIHASDLLAKLPRSVPHRNGNWIEESVIREEKLREFLELYEKGLTNVKKGERRVGVARKEQPLGKSVEFDTNLMIQNANTRTHLAVDIPDEFPDNITPETHFTLMTSHIETGPTARSCFKLQRIPATDEMDKVCGDCGQEDNEWRGAPRYGERFYLVINDVLVGSPMYVASEIKNFGNSSKLSKKQIAHLTFEASSGAEWEFEYTDPAFSMEMEGSAVEPQCPVLIKHCNTGTYLASDVAYGIKTDFGMEYEVMCHNYMDFGTRLKLDQNFWYLRTAK
ncbi:hypothetical protein DFS34DRAFT_631587 [Phlyctochytrium arcticum]|nr:hypothetical protein DFS34DRAFT_631587 [Phlyctochytrium arcticum]